MLLSVLLQKPWFMVKHLELKDVFYIRLGLQTQQNEVLQEGLDGVCCRTPASPASA